MLQYISSKLLFSFAISLFLLIIFNGCAGTERYSETDSKKASSSLRKNINKIRVQLLSTEGEIKFTVKQNLVISDDTKRIAIVKPGNTLQFNSSQNGIEFSIGRTKFESKSFKIFEENRGVISFNNKRYRGELVVEVNAGKIFVVNHLNLEDYLRGVLPVEMGVKGKANYSESLKAFAIAARTFAQSKIEKSNTFFDVYPDVRDQVYGGYDVETEIDNKAVSATFGEVLFYENSLVQVFYHSTCGGMTEDVGNVFSSGNYPYLISKKDGDDNCKISPSFNWTEKYTSSRVIGFINQSNLYSAKNYEITEIKATERFNSGRIKTLNFVFSNDDEINVDYRQIRNLFRRNDNNGMLRSTNFEITTQSNKGVITEIILSGKGNGHGVGLCQWGSISLSEKGWGYKQILEFYFPSTNIKKINA